MEGSLLINVLNIPEVFGDLYAMIHRIAMAFMLPILAMAILHENTTQIAGRADYSRLFLRLICVLGLLILYEKFFMMIVQSMQLLSDAIMPKIDFERTILAVFREITTNKDLGGLGMIKATMINAAINLTYLLAITAYQVLVWLRFLCLSCLYCIGPIPIVLGIYHVTGVGLKFWIRSLIQVSAWTVILSLLIRVASTMNLTVIYRLDETNMISAIAGNVFFIFLFIFTPAITGLLTEGGSFGAVGSMFVGLVTSTAYTIARETKLIKGRNIKGMANAERSRQADEIAQGTGGDYDGISGD